MSDLPFTSPVEDSVPKVDDEIAVGEDIEFQRKWWRFERYVWMFFTALIVLALAGVLGRGPVAKAHMQSPDNAIRVAYDRIQRTGTPSVLRIEVDRPAIQNGAIHLYVSESITRELGAQRVVPQPQSTVTGDGGYTYTFPASAPPAVIELALEPSGPGRFPFKVSVPGGDELNGHIVVLP